MSSVIDEKSSASPIIPTDSTRSASTPASIVEGDIASVRDPARIDSPSDIRKPEAAPLPRPSVQFARGVPEPPQRVDSGGSERRGTFDFGRRRSSDNGRISFQAPRTSLAGPARTTTDAANTLGPPALEYDLRSRKKSIAYFWTLILIDSIAMPLGLYFGLWYGTNLSPNTVFSIVTAALGGISIFEYFVRFWRLFKKDSTCRVIGGRRSYLDWFHWNFTLAWVIIMIELIVGTVPENPPIRLLAMPVTSLLYVFGTEMLIQDGMRLLGIPAPFRISSMPAKSWIRPGIYWIIEDVVAVDGSGGVEFRERLNARYEASHDFRQMLHRLTLFWGIGAETAAVVITILIFTIQRDAAYVVGWAVPFIWAGVWTVCTFAYVKRCMKEEKIRWIEHQGKEVV
ncbi:hypothetical protein AAFC00_003566 [Neodothiora populina]|uniref:Uncharacterized protein n=1 Tax=Neodothiora populina TaxID=2781224 RepID=A0ABR3PEW2_9PEZI